MAFLQKKGSVFFIVEKVCTAKGSWTAKWTKVGAVSATHAKLVLARFQTDKTYLRLDMAAPANMTLTTLFQEFVTHQSKFTDKKPETLAREARFLKIIASEFGHEKIKAFDHEKFMEWCASRTYKPKTVWHYLGALRLAYKYAIEKNYVTTNPCDKIRKPRLIKNPPKHIDEDILWKLMDCFPSHTKPIFEVLLYTGLRPLECFKLTGENIDFKNMVIDLYPHQAKTAERGIIPIHKNLISVLQKLLKEKSPDGFLFPAQSESGHRICAKKPLNDALKVLHERHGIKIHLTPYMFRHTFATRLLNQTGDIRVVQQLMRHKSIQMTTRYATALDAKLREAIEKY